MKRTLSIVLAAIMILSAMALTACGGGGSEDLSDSKYVGTWKSVKLALGDETGDPDFDCILTINGDGTGVTNTSNERIVSDFEITVVEVGNKCYLGLSCCKIIHNCYTPP